jgi:hypothetical protein
VEVRQISFRHLGVAGLLYGLLCLTRPDGILFTAAAVLGILAEFRARYTVVNFEGAIPCRFTFRAWLFRDSPCIGIQRRFSLIIDALQGEMDLYEVSFTRQ